MANIAIFGTLQNVTDGAIAEGTQIVGGRMSVATIAERDAIPASVLKDGTEVYVTETKLTYRWDDMTKEFKSTVSDGNGVIVTVTTEGLSWGNMGPSFAPYNKYVHIPIPDDWPAISNDTVVELFNDQPTLFVKHGFAINMVFTTYLSLVSIGVPESPVTFTIRIGG